MESFPPEKGDRGAQTGQQSRVIRKLLLPQVDRGELSCSSSFKLRKSLGLYN